MPINTVWVSRDRNRRADSTTNPCTTTPVYLLSLTASPAFADRCTWGGVQPQPRHHRLGSRADDRDFNEPLARLDLHRPPPRLLAALAAPAGVRCRWSRCRCRPHWWPGGGDLVARARRGRGEGRRVTPLVVCTRRCQRHSLPSLALALGHVPDQPANAGGTADALAHAPRACPRPAPLRPTAAVTPACWRHTIIVAAVTLIVAAIGNMGRQPKG